MPRLHRRHRHGGLAVSTVMIFYLATLAGFSVALSSVQSSVDSYSRDTSYQLTSTPLSRSMSSRELDRLPSMTTPTVIARGRGWTRKRVTLVSLLVAWLSLALLRSAAKVSLHRKNSENSQCTVQAEAYWLNKHC